MGLLLRVLAGKLVVDLGLGLFVSDIFSLYLAENGDGGGSGGVKP